MPVIDDAIALGNLLVNTGKYTEAVRLLTKLLLRHSNLLAAR